MVLHLADSGGPAGSDTGILALEVEAGQEVRTVVVKLTLALLTEGEGVSLVASGTPTVSSVTIGQALGVRTAGVGVTRVRLDLAARDCVRHRDIAREALTHGVTQPVDITPGVWTTGGGVTRVRGRGPDL